MFQSEAGELEILRADQGCCKKKQKQVHKKSRKKKKSFETLISRFFTPPHQKKQNSAHCKNKCNWNFLASDLTLVDSVFHLKYLLSPFFVLWWKNRSGKTDGQQMSCFSYLGGCETIRCLFNWQEETGQSYLALSPRPVQIPLWVLNENCLPVAASAAAASSSSFWFI